MKKPLPAANKKPAAAATSTTTATQSMAARNADRVAAALEVFKVDRRVTTQAGRFGGASLRVDGIAFAFAVRGELAVKLPPALAEAVIEDGRGRPLVMGARTMQEWIVLADDDPALIRQARDHAAEW